jgi:hypothetical protein
MLPKHGSMVFRGFDMNSELEGSAARTASTPQAGWTFLRAVLALQVALGLLWGISMLFFARQIVQGPPAGPHIEKIAMEGAAHMTLVVGALLVWRAPRRARDVLLLMVFLNSLWTLTDLVYIPLVGLDAVDFPAKVVVNAVLAISLAAAGRRAGLL